MLEIDLHVHSLFSKCGIHTALELIERAKALGMKGLAITDHGPAQGGRLNSPFYERFESPYPDLKLLKGVECNILDIEGTLDLPKKYVPHIDIALAGIHSCMGGGLWDTLLNKDQLTSAVCSAIESYPELDIITHLNDIRYPVDFNDVARCAERKGVALELNNSRLKGRRVRSTVKETLGLIRACKEAGCLVAICSDAHAVNELGGDETITPLLAQENFPKELIMTRSAESVMAFIESRRQFKVKAEKGRPLSDRRSKKEGS